MTKFFESLVAAVAILGIIALILSPTCLIGMAFWWVGWNPFLGALCGLLATFFFIR